MKESLAPDTTLGHYLISSRIGVGGMGEVYRAKDTKLNRDVAIKILPEAFAQDEDRVARFKREAQVLASLNHPNIAAIYGIEESDGIRALVMELVEGPTLADRIAAGPIPLDEGVVIAKQIAEALDVAHERGVIHRDLKPANVKVTPDDKVKVLDFGLAKISSNEALSDDLSHSPTMIQGTQAGMILGTAAYMSPEQARGKIVDKRADIWAFGALLFEMLSGRQAFCGETLTDTLAAVVRAEPDWDALPAGTPDGISRLLRRCLTKDPRLRLRDIGEARILLEADGETAIQRSTPAGMRWGAKWMLALALASLLAGAAVTAIALRSTPSADPSVYRLLIDVPEYTYTVGTEQPLLALATDGLSLAYIGHVEPSGRALFVRRLSDFDAIRIADAGAGASSPFYSSDGAWIGFSAAGSLKKVPVTGGAQVTICALGQGDLRGASWGPDGTIIFGLSNNGLMRVPNSGGEPRELTSRQEGELSHSWPQVLPDGAAVLFVIQRQGSRQVAVLSLKTGEQKVVVENGGFPLFLPPNHLFYENGGQLWAVSFNGDRLAVSGEPRPVLTGFGVLTSGAVDVVVAHNGTLAFWPGEPAHSNRSLVWVDRQGRPTPLPLPSSYYQRLRLSPDGARVAFEAKQGGNESDVWVGDVLRGTVSRLSLGRGADSHPIWTPDGRSVVWYSSQNGGGVVLRSADGAGPVERLTSSTSLQVPFAFSASGDTLVFGEEMPGESGWDLRAIDVRPGGSARGMVEDSGMQFNAVISPDGRWLAYESNEGGRFQVYVRPFPSVSGGRWQVSTTVGFEPAWRSDGRALFFRGPTGAIWEAAVEPGQAFAAGSPTRVAEGNYQDDLGRQFDVAPGGQKLLLIRRDPRDIETEPIHVVLNWTAELDKQTQNK